MHWQLQHQFLPSEFLYPSYEDENFFVMASISDSAFAMHPWLECCANLSTNSSWTGSYSEGAPNNRCCIERHDARYFKFDFSANT